MSDLHERIASSFARQGLMTTLGAQLLRVAPGEVEIALWPRPALSQQHGYVHAGALTSVLDTACGYAALTVATAEANVLTVEFKINFLRPAVAERFVAIGKVARAGQSLSVCQGELIGEHEGQRSTIALMQATIISVADHG